MQKRCSSIVARDASPRPARPTVPRAPQPSQIASGSRSEEHTSELQSLRHLVCRLLLRLRPRSTLFPYTTLFRSARATPCWLAAPAPASARGRTRTTPASNRCRNGAPQSSRATRRLAPRARRCHERRNLHRSHLVQDRKSTRLNSSHLGISYAVFCFASARDLPSFPTRRSSDLLAPRHAGSPRLLLPAPAVERGPLRPAIDAETVLLNRRARRVASPRAPDGATSAATFTDRIWFKIGRAHV